MSSYTIGEAARRSGFSASALRFYEDIRLVVPDRTNSGYRLYNDNALSRLAFIARAKQLGRTLEEITDLADIWDGQQCAPVQQRFHHLVTAKLRSAEDQVDELNAFIAQLRAAADHLGTEPVDGPCGADCACLTSQDDLTASTEPSMVSFGRKPTTKVADGIPIACTLEPAAMPDRLAEWGSILEHATTRTPIDNGLRVHFDGNVDLAELGRLVGAEQHCCAFFSFAITVDHTGIALVVRAPEPATGIIIELFGAPS